MSSLLPGIATERIRTPRLTMNVLSRPGDTGTPVVFVHGNVSSALFWQQTMLALPAELRPLAVDLRGFGLTDPLDIDATRGLADFSDDLAALVDTLQLSAVHLVGWSMGGGVVMKYLLDHPAQVRTLTLVAPLSPYGFGGTTGPDGQLIAADGTGSGAGGANADFVRLLAAADSGLDEPTSPRNVFRGFYVAPGFSAEHEDMYVESMLSTRTGVWHYPGDVRASPQWPGVAPGVSGVLNSMAPTYCHLGGIVDVEPKPPILWIRGDRDLIVSDSSMFDLATLGQLGVIEGWPGPGTHAPQPMLAQTRAVLDRYVSNGGRSTEVVLAGVAHSPHLEDPAKFQSLLLAQLS